jgi:SAM-dependent methyltransferase
MNQLDQKDISYSGPLKERLERIRASSTDILDAGQVDGGYKEYFAGKNYLMLDINPHSGADVIGDIHAIPLPDASIDAFLAFSLIEHAHSPHLMVQEVERVLRPGGKVLLTVPFMHPYHGGMNRGTHCPDYYRFTKDGLEYLFRNFNLELISTGSFFIALKSFFPKPFHLLLDMCNVLRSNGNSVHGYIVYGTKK